MFSQVSVCPQGGGLGLCPGGSPSGGRSVSRGVLCLGGLCPGGGLCLGGLCPVGSLSVGGLCLGGLSSDVSVRESRPYSNERAVRILLECIIVPHISL